MAPECLEDRSLVAGLLQVDLHADVRRLGHDEVKRLVERRQLRGDGPKRSERAAPGRPANGSVGQVREVVGVAENDVAVRGRDHVELDEVERLLERGGERPERVLSCERRSAAVADPERPRAGPSQLERHASLVRRITTTAQSSARSPPAKERQSDRTSRASSSGERPTLRESASSRRPTP